MKIMLCDINPDIVNAWVQELGSEEDIGFYYGKFQEIKESNLIMTAAGNSFGVMGGGIDLAIANFFPGVEKSIQEKISDDLDCFGELLVGKSIRILFYDYQLNYPNAKNWKGLIYSPTMRAPIVINNTDNVYCATYATLIAFEQAKYFTPVDDTYTLVMPGFGGSCGQVCPESIAKQMSLAINNFKQNKKYKKTPTHNEMNYMHAQILAAVRS